MNELDIAVLLITIFSITAFGIWQTRKRDSLSSYLKGAGQTPWWAIGLSVMATQASAITFLSTPGQGYLSGLGFLQIYFGVPLALILISMFFLPIYHKLNVYTAYEYLEKRFDGKTRLLGAVLFLLQRGIGAGLTIYAPAIVLSTVFGWSLQTTIISCGLVVTLYTMLGGTDAVTVTQKYQLAVIFIGMLTAASLLIAKLPPDLSFTDAMHVAGGFGKLKAVNLSTDINERYTLWSGLFGGTFLMLSYFGADQSQVQRYISGSSIRESRLGLLFNAICKIPMQFCILMTGVLMFVFYQFKEPPLFFDSRVAKNLPTYQEEFSKTHLQKKRYLESWVQARHKGDVSASNIAFDQAKAAHLESERIRLTATKELAGQKKPTKTNDADYVFITFILKELPHGVIGLLVTSFFLAALSSKAAELNALGASTTIDFYRIKINSSATDFQCLKATRWFTFGWGLVAIMIALVANFSENLIQAVNILGSIFYGVLLALFLVAFFLKKVGGTAVFWSAIVAQLLIFAMYLSSSISYLWFPLIGCTTCVILSLLLQHFINSQKSTGKTAA
ncbi:sodium:solute symporter [bacterium]|nr:sodium:solute symporter [bacterium]QQR57821.1 MAG: sodium:solute symporter [Candidatus Melainabacteria bacterium]